MSETQGFVNRCVLWVIHSNSAVTEGEKKYDCVFQTGVWELCLYAKSQEKKAEGGIQMLPNHINI